MPGKTFIYIRQDQYAKLAKLMAVCERSTRFPCNSAEASGLYYSRRDDLEIRTPACLVLLSHREYDAAHQKVLGHTETIVLTRAPEKGPGWWLLSEQVA